MSKAKFILGAVALIGGCIAYDSHKENVRYNQLKPALESTLANCDCGDSKHEIVSDKDLVWAKLRETKAKIDTNNEEIGKGINRYLMAPALTNMKESDDPFCAAKGLDGIVDSLLALDSNTRKTFNQILIDWHENAPMYSSIRVPSLSFLDGFDVKLLNIDDKRTNAYASFVESNASQTKSAELDKRYASFKKNKLKSIYVNEFVNQLIVDKYDKVLEKRIIREIESSNLPSELETREVEYIKSAMDGKRKKWEDKIVNYKFHFDPTSEELSIERTLIDDIQSREDEEKLKKAIHGLAEGINKISKEIERETR